jgi:hypothetical protein
LPLAAPPGRFADVLHGQFEAAGEDAAADPRQVGQFAALQFQRHRHRAGIFDRHFAGGGVPRRDFFRREDRFAVDRVRDFEGARRADRRRPRRRGAADLAERDRRQGAEEDDADDQG